MYAVSLKLHLVNGEDVSIGLVMAGDPQGFICPDHVIAEAKARGFFIITDDLPLGSKQGNPGGPDHPRAEYGDRNIPMTAVLFAQKIYPKG